MIKIILVEDDEDDIYFFRSACNNLEQQPHITTLANGAELIEYVNTHNCKGNVILLDLNMPKMGGLETLSHLNQLGLTHELIIITYTTSSHSEDIAKAYKLGVKSYLNKPGNMDELSDLIASISAYWFKYNLSYT